METFPIIEFSDHWIIPLLIALYGTPFDKNEFFKFGLTELYDVDIYCKRVWLSYYLSGKLISKITNKLGTVHESIHIAQRSNRKLYFHCFIVVVLLPICRPSVKTSLISHCSSFGLWPRFFDGWLWWSIRCPLYIGFSLVLKGYITYTQCSNQALISTQCIVLSCNNIN